jgi:hypothetical protein
MIPSRAEIFESKLADTPQIIHGAGRAVKQQTLLSIGKIHLNDAFASKLCRFYHLMGKL